MREWISVEDELPKYTGEYIVYCNVGCILGGFTDVRCYRFENIKGKEPKWIINENFNEVVSITHWMSLPEPPKED